MATSTKRFRRRIATLTTAILATVSIAGAWTLAGSTPVDGFLLDATIRARSIVSPPPEGNSPVVVIGLDGRTLDSDEIADVPRVFLAPYWAKLLDTVFTAGAKGVGFDAIFSYSSNRFRPDYDKPFLEALGKHKDRVVIARTFSSLPADPFQFAVGAMQDPTALGLVEMTPDSDGVVRWIPSSAPSDDGAPVPTLTGALIKRTGLPPMPSEVLVAPTRSLENVPTFSMIDVLRCGASDPKAVEKYFKDKIVLIGTILPEEDRKVSAGRFLPTPPPRPEPAEDATCALSPLGASIPGASTVPGVYLHAGVIEAVATGNLTIPAKRHVVAAIAIIAVVIGCFLGFSTAPAVALGGAVVGLAVLFATGVGLLMSGIWLPLAVPMIVLPVSVGLAYAVRFALESSQRRRLQSAFGRYLAPTIVNRLADGAELTLGGETREATVMFADLSGFTALSGTIPPAELVAVTNVYLGIMVDEIERTGGYVDKFIGDAVMAYWNAPVDDPNHTEHAVMAAEAIVRRIKARAAETPPGKPKFSVKIGLEAGLTTVGNVGSEGRCNYTAIGETVNVAARLESVPPDYHCNIVLGEAAAAHVEKIYLLREIDSIMLKGRSRPLRVFEPVCRQPDADEGLSAAVERFAQALRLYRDRRFTEAQQLWTQLTEGALAEKLLPGPAAVMASRAAELAENSPGPEWNAVWVRHSK